MISLRAKKEPERQAGSPQIKIKILDLQNTRGSLLKREEGTYHHNEKLMKEMPGFFSPGKGVSLPSIFEYSGINKGQRFLDRSITVHGKPPVNCFLTIFLILSHLPKRS